MNSSKSFADIKTIFEQLKKRKKGKACPLGLFVDANDFWSFPEMLSHYATPKAKQLEQKLSPGDAKSTSLEMKGNESKQAAANIIDLVVGPSDIFSIDTSSDHVHLCDINRELLKFVEEERKLLLYWYAKYLAKELTFQQVKASYLSWGLADFETEKDALRRKNYLGKFHFLSSEEKYNSCMQALQAKEFATLDFDLFDPKEQDAYITALVQANHTIRYINFTNLPDYDDKCELPGFLIKLQMSKRLTADFRIFWNIHDRGPWAGSRDKFPFGVDLDLYTHYPFTVNSILEYLEHVQKRPLFFADIDREAIECFAHVSVANIKNTMIFHRYNENSAFREEYLNHLFGDRKNTLDILKKDIVRYRPRNTDCCIFLINLNRYESQINNLIKKLKKAFELIKAFMGKDFISKIEDEILYYEGVISRIRFDDVRDKNGHPRLLKELDLCIQAMRLLTSVMLIIEILGEVDAKIVSHLVGKMKGILDHQYDNADQQDILREELHQLAHNLRDNLKPADFNKLAGIVFSIRLSKLYMARDFDFVSFARPTLQQAGEKWNTTSMLETPRLRWL